MSHIGFGHPLLEQVQVVLEQQGGRAIGFVRHQLLLFGLGALEEAVAFGADVVVAIDGAEGYELGLQVLSFERFLLAESEEVPAVLYHLLIGAKII